MLRIQCGAGVIADYFHQFRRRKGRKNPGDAEICSWNSSGILIYLLPAVFSGNAIWFAMPITEFIVAVYVIHEMIKYTKQLSAERMG